MEESKKISIHHLYYVLIIGLLIIIGLILIVPSRVSDTAFDNFSFASTITSIVLAVVSIVYSIQSGNISNIQLDSVRGIDTEIKKQLEGFSHIEDNISKLVNGRMASLQDDVKKLSDGQIEISSRILSLGKNPVSNGIANSQTANLEKNSAFGDVLLYACSLSFKKKKALPTHVFEENLNDFNYWYGYFIALTVTLPNDIRVEYCEGDTSPLASNVVFFKEDVLGSIDSLRNRLDKFCGENEENRLMMYVKKIDEYFNDDEESIG